MQFLRNFIGELPDDFRILSYTKKLLKFTLKFVYRLKKWEDLQVENWLE